MQKIKVELVGADAQNLDAGLVNWLVSLCYKAIDDGKNYEVITDSSLSGEPSYYTSYSTNSGNVTIISSRDWELGFGESFEDLAKKIDAK